MFDKATVGGDTMVDTLSVLLRMQPDGVQMTLCARRFPRRRW